MSHHCHARGCTRAVRPEYLMCPPHWRRVPANVQQAVYRHYRVGQCDDKNPSAAWHEAADAAIGFVAMKEERIVTITEGKAMHAYGVASPTILENLTRLEE